MTVTQLKKKPLIFGEFIWDNIHTGTPLPVPIILLGLELKVLFSIIFYFSRGGKTVFPRHKIQIGNK